MKNQTELTLRLPEELLRKLIYISNAEGRSPNNHLILLLRNNIQYFERTKGRISPAALQSVELSQAFSERRAAVEKTVAKREDHMSADTAAQTAGKARLGIDDPSSEGSKGFTVPFEPSVENADRVVCTENPPAGFVDSAVCAKNPSAGIADSIAGAGNPSASCGRLPDAEHVLSDAGSVSETET